MCKLNFLVVYKYKSIPPFGMMADGWDCFAVIKQM